MSLAVFSSALAQVDKITPAKDFPGADLIANLLSWGMYLALALSVGRASGLLPGPD